MRDKLIFELDFDSDLEDRQQAVKDAIEGNADQFAPLLERKIDHTDARTELLPDIYVPDVSFDDATTGTATIEFETEQYSGCKDMRGGEEHDVDVDFRIKGKKLKFRIELPPCWKQSERGD